MIIRATQVTFGDFGYLRVLGRETRFKPVFSGTPLLLKKFLGDVRWRFLFLGYFLGF